MLYLEPYKLEAKTTEYGISRASNFFKRNTTNAEKLKALGSLFDCGLQIKTSKERLLHMVIVSGFLKIYFDNGEISISCADSSLSISSRSEVLDW